MDKLIGCLFYSCAVAKLENQLVGVEALRDLKAELITRKEVWYNVHVYLYDNVYTCRQTLFCLYYSGVLFINFFY